MTTDEAAPSFRDDLPASEAGEKVIAGGAADLPMDPKLCRLCLMAAIVFAFGKEAALLI